MTSRRSAALAQVAVFRRATFGAGPVRALRDDVSGIGRILFWQLVEKLLRLP
ncbi:MAG: hypothetical protein FD165_177 [Gammaproteobacteria bacterium]|nr:MAG: hypothetical protein FD165_177 [Gammaproteobacteria bacterium]TND06755.1 MAG: hypothetical protein FD120_487 [Gammaproteobacteria bacterium]